MTNRAARVFLGLLAVLGAAPAAQADIIGASKDYKAGDYPHAFQEFLALAKLGAAPGAIRCGDFVPGIFETMVRESLLHSQFSREPAGSAPVQCTMPYNFILTGRRIGGSRASMEDFEAELGYRTDLAHLAKDGAPDAQLVYGLLLDGPFKEDDDTGGSKKAAIVALRVEQTLVRQPDPVLSGHPVRGVHSALQVVCSTANRASDSSPSL